MIGRNRSYFKRKFGLYIPNFTPLTIPDCALWLEADRGITLDGSDNVSAWADQSGNSRHATQTTPALRPAWTESGLNGRPVLTFNGDYLNVASFAQTTAITVFIVADYDSGSSYRVLLRGHDGFSCYGGSSVDGQPVVYIYPNKYISWGSPVIAPSIYEFGVTASEGMININGGAPVTDTPLAARDNWGTIAANSDGSQGFVGTIAAILVWHRELTATERNRIRNHYSYKYDIALAT